MTNSMERLGRGWRAEIMAASSSSGAISPTGRVTWPIRCIATFQAAAIRALAGRQRLNRLSTLVQQARHAEQPAAAFASLQRALVEWRALGPPEALLLLRALPDAVPVAPDVIRLAVDELGRSSARPTARTLDALAVLNHRRVLPHRPRFDHLLAEDQAVADFVHATTTTRFRDDPDGSPAGWSIWAGSIPRSPAPGSTPCCRPVLTCRPPGLAPGCSAGFLPADPAVHRSVERRAERIPGHPGGLRRSVLA